MRRSSRIRTSVQTGDGESLDRVFPQIGGRESPASEPHDVVMIEESSDSDNDDDGDGSHGNDNDSSGSSRSDLIVVGNEVEVTDDGSILPVREEERPTSLVEENIISMASFQTPAAPSNPNPIPVDEVTPEQQKLEFATCGADKISQTTPSLEKNGGTSKVEDDEDEVRDKCL